MSERGKFEDRLREKLESFEAPYEPAHWAAYRQKYRPGGGLSFLKTWYLPYLFSAALFGLAWFWWGSGPKKDPLSALPTRVDTLYVQQTIRIYDTLVIRDTVYLQASPKRLSRPSSASRPSFLAQAQNSPAEGRPAPQARQRGAKSARDPFPRREEEEARASDSQVNKPAQEDWRSPAMRDRVARWRQRGPDSLDSDSTRSSAPAQASAASPSRDSLPADSLPASEEALAAPASDSASSAREFFAPLKESLQGQDFRFFVGPQTRLFSPFRSNGFDTYGGVFGGLGLGLGLQRWELLASAHYGFMQHEFSRPSALPQDRLALFPAYLSLSPRPDYIEIWTQQFLLPLSVAYRPWRNDNWSWRLEAGVLGNYLLRESFEYSYRDDNIDAIEGINSGFDDPRFKFSHLQVGSGMAYQYQRRWRLEAGLIYYHPLEEKLGLSRLNAGALSLNLAYYYFLF